MFSLTTNCNDTHTQGSFLFCIVLFRVTWKHEVWLYWNCWNIASLWNLWLGMYSFQKGFPQSWFQYILTELQMFLHEGIICDVQIEFNWPTYSKVFWVRRNGMNHEVCNLYICLFQLKESSTRPLKIPVKESINHIMLTITLSKFK